MSDKSSHKESPFGPPDPSYRFNAAVGTNGGPYNFANYGDGYFTAGDLLARNIINAESGKWKGRNLSSEDKEWLVGGLYVDVLFYPLLYCYRQGTELFMKHFIYDKARPPKNDLEHDLKVLWTKAKKEIEQLFPHPPYNQGDLRSRLSQLEDFILKLHELDPRGEVTRFPEDPKGNKFLQDYWLVNIQPIAIAARRAHELFSDFVEERSEIEMYLAESSEEIE